MRIGRGFAVSLVMALATLSACGVSPESNSTGGAGDVAVMETPSKDLGTTSVAQSPAVIRTGDLSLQTGNVEKAFADIKALIVTLDGRVETSNFQGRMNGYGPSAYLTLRVPESKLDAAVEEISKIGKRTSLSINTTDVTLQTLDLQAKVDALIESRTRLEKLLEKTTTTAELIAGEQAMATLRTELDSYQSQLDYLKNQVAESTLNVSIVNDDSSVTSGLKSFREIFLQAIRGFLQAFQNSFIFIITAIPWVLVITLIATIVRFALRFISQILKRKKRKNPQP